MFDKKRHLYFICERNMYVLATTDTFSYSSSISIDRVKHLELDKNELNNKEGRMTNG